MDIIRVDIRSMLSVLLILFLFSSCKKDHEEPGIPIPVFEHVADIHGIRGGLDDYRETYHYDDGILADYYILRPGKEGKWLDWLRFSYEYPEEDRIIETRYGISDSLWFPANKNEKRIYGDELEELIQYEYDGGYPGNWRPVRKVEWKFNGDRVIERMTYTYPDEGWEAYIRSEYEYTGSYWTGMKSFKNNNGTWDTIGCMALIYIGGRLDEVNVYECHHPGGWTLNEQYILHYDGILLTSMVINEISGDSLQWERSIFISYNPNGNPESYIYDYACCPTEEIFITYEVGKGNFRQATQGYSEYMTWPWFPAPVK